MSNIQGINNNNSASNISSNINSNSNINIYNNNNRNNNKMNNHHGSNDIFSKKSHTNYTLPISYKDDNSSQPNGDTNKNEKSTSIYSLETLKFDDFETAYNLLTTLQQRQIQSSIDSLQLISQQNNKLKFQQKKGSYLDTKNHDNNVVESSTEGSTASNTRHSSSFLQKVSTEQNIQNNYPKNEVNSTIAHQLNFIDANEFRAEKSNNNGHIKLNAMPENSLTYISQFSNIRSNSHQADQQSLAVNTNTTGNTCANTMNTLTSNNSTKHLPNYNSSNNKFKNQFQLVYDGNYEINPQTQSLSTSELLSANENTALQGFLDDFLDDENGDERDELDSLLNSLNNSLDNSNKFANSILQPDSHNDIQFYNSFNSSASKNPVLSEHKRSIISHNVESAQLVGLKVQEISQVNNISAERPGLLVTTNLQKRTRKPRKNLLSEEQRRENHTSSEKKRRSLIKESFDLLLSKIDLRINSINTSNIENSNQIAKKKDKFSRKGPGTGTSNVGNRAKISKFLVLDLSAQKIEKLQKYNEELKFICLINGIDWNSIKEDSNQQTE